MKIFSKRNCGSGSPLLRTLIDEYEKAAPEFKATSYWASAQEELNRDAVHIEPRFLRSGKYGLIRKFGFGDLIYSRPPPDAGVLAQLRHDVLSLLAPLARKIPGVVPYGLTLGRIRQLAYNNCDLYGRSMGAPALSEVSVSTYGAPEDIFRVGESTYSMQFLSMYLRYAFAHPALGLEGNEVVVELGQGNGMQIELLKRMYPDLTVLCFDLPVQTYLSEHYLANALGKEAIVSSGRTRHWNRLSALEPGKVHFLGSWQFPLLETLKNLDLFWNAASFGEMEPDVVRNYLSYVKGRTRSIYLCNATHGKELDRGGRPGSLVTVPVRFEDYVEMLSEYHLVSKGIAWSALGPMLQSGGYFQAVWRLEQ